MFGSGKCPIRQAFQPLFLLLSAVCFVSAALAAPAPAHPPDPALETVGRLGIESIPVAIGVKIEQIAGVDQKAENFKAVIRTVMRYKDPALAYEPKGRRSAVSHVPYRTVLPIRRGSKRLLARDLLRQSAGKSRFQ